ncbi:MAG: Rrf2 family transcriptional regulator [Saprospiraceae bacterium]|jgi:DNA-binding IscR family transcriptional regulator|nr:Rrf2 family transcriptional regulator [Saprospiraceae bacterium]
MILSQSCRAAIKALVFIATYGKDGHKTSIKEIAIGTGENEHTIGKTLQLLVKNDSLNSQKGPAGGFYLTPEQSAKPLIDIVILLDGNQIFNGCVLGLPQCSAKTPCPMHFEFKEIRDNLVTLFRDNTVGSLSEELLKGGLHLIQS